MKFKLPTSRELTDDQNKIINLRTDRNWVIQGSPGTGKSVMALFRAAQISAQMKNGQKVLILVFNKPLQQYIETALNDNKTFRNCTVNTYHSWIWKLYWNYKLGEVPQIPSDHSFKEVDWDATELQIRKLVLERGKLYHHIIVDEAQDFPQKLIRILTLIADNITCFIDPNQTITTGKTDTAIALEETCTESPFKLRENFRNTKPIADFSELYWNREGLLAKASKPGSKPRMIKIEDQGMMIYQEYRNRNLSESNLIRTGTVHSMQGTEADIVIFDLTVARPIHYSPFSSHQEDAVADMKKTLNTALTRAKFKLFFVGDFNYSTSLANNTPLSKLLFYFRTQNLKENAGNKYYKHLLKDLESYKIEGIRLCHDIIEEAEFKKSLPDTISRAEESIKIYSPRITMLGIQSVKKELYQAARRGIKIDIYTAMPDGSEEVRVLQEIARCTVHVNMNECRCMLLEDDRILLFGNTNILSDEIKTGNYIEGYTSPAFNKNAGNIPGFISRQLKKDELVEGLKDEENNT